MVKFADIVLKIGRRARRTIARVSSNRDKPIFHFIGAKRIKTLRFIEAESKKRTLMTRQASKRVTLPKKWDLNVTHVQVTLMKHPETGDFLGILVEALDEGKGAN